LAVCGSIQTPQTHESRQPATLRVIAVFESVKGFAAISASLSLLSLVYHDVQALAQALIGHFPLDPRAYYPRMLLEEAALASSVNLRQAVLLLWAYSSIGLSEAYGLWRDRALAE